jgi:hypothetical protein
MELFYQITVHYFIYGEIESIHQSWSTLITSLPKLEWRFFPMAATQQYHNHISHFVQ